VSLGAFLFGYDSSIIGAVNLYIEDEWNLSVFVLEVIVAITVLGSILGAAASGWLSDRYGRKPVIWAAALVFAVGSIVMAVAPNVIAMIFGRLLVGIAIGVSSMVQTIYIAEVAPYHIRGALVASLIMFVTGG
jgi:MFS family permease